MMATIKRIYRNFINSQLYSESNTHILISYIHFLERSWV